MKSLRIAIHALAAILLVAVAAWYFSAHWDAVVQIKLSSGMVVGLVAMAFFLRITIRGMLNWFMLRELYSDIDWREILCLQYAGTMMGSLLPMPIGVGYRAAYLRGVHQVSLTLFASMITAIFVYSLMVSAAGGLLAMLWVGLTDGTVRFAAVAILGSIVAGGTAVLFLPQSLPGENRWIIRLNRVLTGWKRITRSRRLVVAATLVVMATSLLGAAGVYCAFRAFGIAIEIPGAMLLMSSQNVGGLIKLTPGAIGFQETVSAYFAIMLKVTTVETVVVLGAARVVRIAVTLLTGLPSLWYLSRSGRHPSRE